MSVFHDRDLFHDRDPRDYPEVKVEEITLEKEQEILGTTPAKEVDLGGKYSPQAASIESDIGGLYEALRKKAIKIFLLKWQGNKVPRGAKVLNYEINWTQNGQVLSSEGQDIGTYSRLVEFGGDSGKEHEMLVYLLPDGEPSVV